MKASKAIAIATASVVGVSWVASFVSQLVASAMRDGAIGFVQALSDCLCATALFGAFVGVIVFVIAEAME